MKPAIVGNPASAYRQRGYADGYHGRDETVNRASAARAGEECLAEYLRGLRIGKRQREAANGSGDSGGA